MTFSSESGIGEVPAGEFMKEDATDAEVSLIRQTAASSAGSEAAEILCEWNWQQKSLTI